MSADVGSSGAEYPASQPEEGGSSPTPTLKSFRANLVPRSEIREFVERHHYSRNIDGVNSTYCFDFRDPDGKLVGAMILGRPAARRAGKYGKKVIEIRRLVCVDGTPKNTESRFIGYVLRWLAVRTKHDAVLAYSDLEHGHEGGIYAASNFRKVGRIPGAPVILWNGRKHHDRSLRPVEGRLKPFSRKLQAAVQAGRAKVRKTKGKVVWVYRWKTIALPDPPRVTKSVAKKRRQAVHLAPEVTPLSELLDQLRKEHAELTATIAYLERREGTTARGSKAAAKVASQPKARGRTWSEAARRKMSLAVKRAIAAKKKAATARKPKRTAPKPKAAPKAPQAAS